MHWKLAFVTMTLAMLACAVMGTPLSQPEAAPVPETETASPAKAPDTPAPSLTIHLPRRPSLRRLYPRQASLPCTCSTNWMAGLSPIMPSCAPPTAA